MASKEAQECPVAAGADNRLHNRELESGKLGPQSPAQDQGQTSSRQALLLAGSCHFHEEVDGRSIHSSIHPSTHPSIIQPAKFSVGQLHAGLTAKKWAAEVSKEIAVCKRPLSGWETDLNEINMQTNAQPQTSMDTWKERTAAIAVSK